MSKETSKEEKKCTVVHIPIHLLKLIEESRAKSAKSKNEFLVALLEKGLNSNN